MPINPPLSRYAPLVPAPGCVILFAHVNPMEVCLHYHLTYNGKSSFVFALDGELVTKYLERVLDLRPGVCWSPDFSHPSDRAHLAQDEAEFTGNVRLRRLNALLFDAD